MAQVEKVDLSLAARISQEESRAMLDAGSAVFVDLRYSYIYDLMHVPGAVNLELKDVIKHAQATPSGKTIVYYCDCASEETSARAVLLAGKRGIANTRAFIGTIEQWVEAGHPFEATPLVDEAEAAAV
jgi:rhodanese-related sulfurtransferase